MSVGGHSLHRKDYALLAGAMGATALGFGAAGMGPMAGLFGGAAEGAVGAGAGATAAGAALPGGSVAGMGGGTAAMFGPTAAGSALVDAFALPAAATPTVGAIGADAIAGIGAPAVGIPEIGAGAGTAYQPGLFKTMHGSMANMLQSGPNPMSGLDRLDALKGFADKAGRGMQMANATMGGQPQPAAPAPMGPRPQAPQQVAAHGQGQQRTPQPGDPDFPAYLEYMRKRGRYGG